jgi:hypothetical protein
MRVRVGQEIDSDGVGEAEPVVLGVRPEWLRLAPELYR